jgi:alkanesulfonate monooxygenase SsuD/methylene tetrahydromethanopterin reductase-like flavin-dependent oxidoreductase (luciferase family)
MSAPLITSLEQAGEGSLGWAVLSGYRFEVAKVTRTTAAKVMTVGRHGGRERHHYASDVTVLPTEHEARKLSDYLNSSKARCEEAVRQAQDRHRARVAIAIAFATNQEQPNV